MSSDYSFAPNGPTMKNVPTMHWETCPRLCSASDCLQGKSLLLNCLLDGEAYGIDIDATAVHMAYIQLSLLHILAIIIHGNALSLEQWGVKQLKIPLVWA